MSINIIIQNIVTSALPIIIAVVFHEVAHGWVAYKFGDPTAKQMGRLTLNPIAHIDLIGTIIVPLLLIISGGPLFGWAKPVPVNSRNLKNPKEDMVWVAAAGPATNILIASLCALCFRLLYLSEAYKTMNWFMYPLLIMLEKSVLLNIFLAIFNLIPIPPTDGGRITIGLLPLKQALAYSKIEPIGIFLLMLILYFDPLGIYSHFIMPIHFTIVKWLLV